MTAPSAPEPSRGIPRPTLNGPTDFVIDAGVAIRWSVPDVPEAEAKRFLDPASTLHVPELRFAEVGNILWKKARVLRTPEITVSEGRDIIGLLMEPDSGPDRSEFVAPKAFLDLK